MPLHKEFDLDLSHWQANKCNFPPANGQGAYSEEVDTSFLNDADCDSRVIQIELEISFVKQTHRLLD